MSCHPARRLPLYLLLALAAVALSAGCPRQSRSPSPPAATSLTVVIVGDPAIAAAVKRLQGEWKAQTGISLEIAEVAEEKIAAGEVPRADCLIAPSYQLGVLDADEQVLPLPEELRPSVSDFWNGVPSGVWVEEASWRNDLVAVPFGSPVFTCYYRADLLEKLNRQPPQTWEEYASLAQLLARDSAARSNRASSGQSKASLGALEPLAPGWAGLVLLARAASYAAHPDNYSVFFSIDTTEPLIDGPPFQRALEELVAAARTSPVDPLQLTPAGVREAFWQGKCGLAMSWPSAAEPRPSGRAEGIEVGFSELPGSVEVYDPVRQLWDKRRGGEAARVALLAVAGRLGVVRSESRHPDEAFQLLMWLAGDKWSPQVSGTSGATTLFRASHVAAPQDWVEHQLSATAAADYGELTMETLSHSPRLLAPRIAGRDQYLAALDEAVAQAVRGEKSAADALAQAAERWRDITQRLGRSSQARAIWASLGLE